MDVPLPAAFIARMRADLGDGFEPFLLAMQQTPRRSLRVNTLKITPERFMELLGLSLAPAGVIPEGFWMPEGLTPGRDPLHAAGLYYMQEPSAQLPARLLGVEKGDAVLDLAAAPGGKSGQIAEALDGTGVLVANEPVPERAAVLVRTLERLGVQNAIVTCMQADALCERMAGVFDRVLVDAPCAGEGMFRKEPAAIASWSEAHVASCAVRQRLMLDSASQALRMGGTLVYATCSFSKAENEDTVQHFLKAHPEFSLIEMRRLYPHTSPGEGQFMAKLVKHDTGRARTQPVRGEACQPFADFCRHALTARLPDRVRVLPDGRALLLPPRMPLFWEQLRIRRAGLLLGEVRGGRFMPDHALFLGLPADAFAHQVALTGEPLQRYLAGESVPVPASLRGYAAVTASGYPIGFGKAAGGTLKNHYPKGLRVPL